MIEYSVDGDGIATIAWNMTDRSMNVLNDESVGAFAEKVGIACGDAAVKGVIITSKRRDFLAGADLTRLAGVTDAATLSARSSRFNALLRGLETSGKPFCAAINGTALGGGYEIALACHRRIAADNPKTEIGLPEVTIGLLPGGGGTQRLPRMIGIRNALPLLVEGRKFDPQKALAAGLVDAVVPADQLLAAAKAWLLSEGPKNAVKPWDKKGYQIPDGPVIGRKGSETFVAGNALLREKTYGNYPAARNIASCVYEGLIVDIDNGLKIETRYFVNCALSPAARNMIRTLFFSIGEANKLATRPKDVPEQAYKKIGVLGAGMMGAGIAYVSAVAGIDVVLLDTTIEAAEKGRAYSRSVLDKRVQQKRLSETERDAVLSRIAPTINFSDLKGCDMVIEAVFEDRSIKADVTRKAEAVIADSAIFASNTSTLPITGLAEASGRPENFIGLHFFSPVDRMPLVEIIRGRKTSDATLARAMDYVKRIRKTPITVNDSRGFYTSRVFGTYVNEGLALLAEGVSPALIDNAGRMAGMPVGPLALADEVSLDLMYKVRKQTRADLGKDYKGNPKSDALIDLLVEKLGRIGKKAGKGFYDYPGDGRKKHLWPGLATHFPLAGEQPDVEEVKKRLLYVQSIETARCLEERVVTDPKDADVGSILGWGFPPFLGGTMSQIHTIGIERFVAECDRLAQKYGERFAPPKLLRDMAAAGKALYAA
ncbi:MAG TPA: 3-hydroxyacyl-CoA dehydrogenase NAD-binding domain-containing protein [Stellaceae bacterium]|nr:3-hydroxyacyl-CoA dehydrogenase NAD-binding domain-containing protein [Stellaceae bacterium]